MIDPRIYNLSYSSLGLLHSCPRKFQLYRLNSIESDDEKDVMANITFAFGHVVGLGIQLAIKGSPYPQIIFEMFQAWHADLMDEDIKRNKSFFTAMLAVQKFLAMQKAGLLRDYELVYYQGEPAIELGFRITFPNGFKFRGYVDVVLQHKVSQEVLVLELKTSSANQAIPAQFKNSSQAIGYSIVLDVLFPTLSSYKVLYLIYLTKSMQYERLDFTKSYLQRALWIQELLLDIEIVELYEKTGIYPMRGESCYAFFKECPYLNLCTLSTSHLIKAYNAEGDKNATDTFQIELKLVDLVNSQLSKSVPSIQEDTIKTPTGEFIKDEIL